jgi:hypothetical protein
MWNEYGGKGLNMYLLESQGTAEEKLKAFLKGKGFTAPVQMGGMAGYPGDRGLPFAYVIGVDGTVVFEGRGDYHAAVKVEMAKIKYPGLGKLEVAKGLEKAAGNFVAKAYAKAIDDCNSVSSRRPRTRRPWRTPSSSSSAATPKARSCARGSTRPKRRSAIWMPFTDLGNAEQRLQGHGTRR